MEFIWFVFVIIITIIILSFQGFEDDSVTFITP